MTKLSPQETEPNIDELAARIRELEGISDDKREDLLELAEDIKVSKAGKLKSAAIKNLISEIESASRQRQKTRAVFESLVERHGLKRMQTIIGDAVKLDQSIKEFFEKKENPVIEFQDKSSGVQSGTSVLLQNGEKYYVKTYEGHKFEKLDPRELLAYKFLELTGFGQKVEFIPGIKSKIVDGYYIATLDASQTKNPNKNRVFKTMSKYEAEHGREASQLQLSEFLKDKNFAIECVALEILDRNFGFTDTFTNPGNYGIVEIKFKDNFATSKIKPKLIDLRIAEHLGAAAEGNFTSKINSERLKEIELGALELIRSGKTKFYCEEEGEGKIRLGAIEALLKASSFIKENIIDKSRPSILIDNPHQQLDEYVGRVKLSIESTISRQIESHQL